MTDADASPLDAATAAMRLSRVVVAARPASAR